MSYTENSLVEQPAIQLFAELGLEMLPFVNALIENDATPSSLLKVLSRR